MKGSGRPLRGAILSRRLPLAVLGVSLCCHAMAVFLAGSEAASAVSRQDFLILVCLCAALDVAGFAVRTVAAFRTAHAVRFLALLTAVRLDAWTDVLVPVFLTVPFFLETTLSEEDRPALAINGAFLAGILADLFFLPARPARLPPAALLASYALVAVPFAALGSLLVLYRERLVKSTARVERLHGTLRNLFKANAAFQQYAHHIESETLEKERNRITRELHDSVGYALTNVLVMMNAGKLLLKENPAALEALLGKVGDQAEQALATTRQILHKLRDIRGAERVGLQSIAHLAKNFQGATGVAVSLDLGTLKMSYGRDLDSLIFRFVQEALTNSFRHGVATKVSIHLRQTAEEIVMVVHDNGVGVPDGVELVEGIGFAGMRERLAGFGGCLSHRNAIDGFELSAVIPYRTSGFQA